MNIEFMECFGCSIKPGSPTLCKSCLHNRRVIEELQKYFNRIQEIKRLREELKSIKCKCSGFVLQYEGSCQCMFEIRHREAQKKLYAFIDSL